MKYLLTNIIKSLKKEEVRQFKTHHSKYAQKGNKKRTLMLFDLIRNGKIDEYDAEIVNVVEGIKNKNNYYRVKNRLLNDLVNSLLSIHCNSSEEFELSNKVRMAQILMDKLAYDEAAFFLGEAEKMANNDELTSVLLMIYTKQLKLASIQMTDPEPILEKKEKLIEKIRNNDRLDHVLIKLSYRLLRSNFSSKEKGAIEILESVLEEMKLQEGDRLSPKAQLRIHKCARKILLQKRAFKELASYLSKTYIEFQEQGFFEKKNHEEKIIILVWLINALSRVGEVDKVREFTKVLGEAINSYEGLYYDKYLWVFVQSEMLMHTLEGNPQKAIIELEKLIENQKAKNIIDFFHVYLNLAILNFYIENFEASILYVSKIIVSEDFRELPQSWQLNIEIVNLILRYETGDLQYAENRYQDIRRRFRTEFYQSQYEEQLQFIELVRDFILKPEMIKKSKNISRIQLFIDKYPNFEIGANESLNYQIWLQSKLNKSSYFETMQLSYQQLSTH